MRSSSTRTNTIYVLRRTNKSSSKKTIYVVIFVFLSFHQNGKSHFGRNSLFPSYIFWYLSFIWETLIGPVGADSSFGNHYRWQKPPLLFPQALNHLSLRISLFFRRLPPLWSPKISSSSISKFSILLSSPNYRATMLE